MNNRNFGDREMTLEELKPSFFYTLYLRTTTFISSLVISIMISLFYFLPLFRHFLMYIFLCS